MPYNFIEISDEDLKLFFAVINDLEHKARLLGHTGPLQFSNTPKGVSRDEQMAIIHRLEKESYFSFSNNGKYIWLNEHSSAGNTYGDLFDSVHHEYHARFSKQETKKAVQPHYDDVNGYLYVKQFKVRIRIHDEDSKQVQLLRHIFIANKNDIGREFDFTEFQFDDIDDERYKKEKKEICRTACREINRKIAKESKNEISNFIDYNSRTYGYLKLNPEYLQ